MRKDQKIPDDMPSQEFDWEDASFILMVKPDGSWACDIPDPDITSRTIGDYLHNIAQQFTEAEE